MEAFGLGPIREHHFRTFDPKVDIARLGDIGLLNASFANQMLRCNKHFAIVKQQFCIHIYKQNLVVWRQQHIPLWQTIAQESRFDKDRLRIAREVQAGHGLAANPSDSLEAIVAGNHPIASLQVLDKPLNLPQQGKIYSVFSPTT